METAFSWLDMIARPLLCAAACFTGCLVFRKRYFPDKKQTISGIFAALGTALTAGLTAASLAFGKETGPESASAAWAFACVSVCLFGASLSDCRTRTVRDLFPLCIALCGLAAGPLSARPLWIRSSGAFCVYLLLFAVNRLCGKKAVGGADLKLTAACFFVFGPAIGIPGLLAGLLFAVVSETVKKVRNRTQENKCSNTENRPHVFPLVPYLTAGFLLADLLSAVARMLN